MVSGVVLRGVAVDLVDRSVMRVDVLDWEEGERLWNSVISRIGWVEDSVEHSDELGCESLCGVGGGFDCVMEGGWMALLGGVLLFHLKVMAIRSYSVVLEIGGMDGECVVEALGEGMDMGGVRRRGNADGGGLCCSGGGGGGDGGARIVGDGGFCGGSMVSDMVWLYIRRSGCGRIWYGCSIEVNENDSIWYGCNLTSYGGVVLSWDESIWYGCTLEVQRMSRYGMVVHLRGSTDESIWYGCTLEVQRMIRYVMVVHSMFKDDSDTPPNHLTKHPPNTPV
ncbi:hypothetical protein Tco_0676366 [Tanacetum coccineum]